MGEQLRAQLAASQNDVERLTAELVAERAATARSQANARCQVELIQAELDSAGQAILEGRSEVTAATQEAVTLRHALAMRNQEANVKADALKSSVTATRQDLVESPMSKQIEDIAEGSFAVRPGASVSVNGHDVETQDTLVLLIGMVEKDTNQGEIEDRNEAPDTPVKPIDAFWSKAHSLGTVNVPGISEVMAEVKKYWHLLPSWKACIRDSDASCGSRLIQGRVLSLGQCEEVQSFRVFDLEKNNTQYLVEDVEVTAVVLRNAQRHALEKQTEDFHRKRSHLLERLRLENANMATSLSAAISNRILHPT